MVDVVKAPEKRHAMIRHMPVVEGQVHQKKTEGQLEPGRKCDEVNETKWFFTRPGEGPLRRGLNQSRGRRKCQNGDRDIHEQAA